MDSTGKLGKRAREGGAIPAALDSAAGRRSFWLWREGPRVALDFPAQHLELSGSLPGREIDRNQGGHTIGEIPRHGNLLSCPSRPETTPGIATARLPRFGPLAINVPQQKCRPRRPARKTSSKGQRAWTHPMVSHTMRGQLSGPATHDA